MLRPTLLLSLLVASSFACGPNVEPREATTPSEATSPTEIEPQPHAQPASASVSASASASAPEPPEAERKLPEACVEGPTCEMPAEFGERLCAGSQPEVALHLFAPKTPWKRLYLRRSFKAWHVGGRGELRELRAGEEVIVVSVPKTSGTGMQIGGQAFEVLRWDGTCVSLMEDEISTKRPSNAVPANIPWKDLETSYRATFKEEKAIELAQSVQQRLCESPNVDKEPGKSKCELARRHLSLTIAQSVGKGKALPPLSYVP